MLLSQIDGDGGKRCKNSFALLAKMSGRIINEAIFGVLKMKFKSLLGKE